MRTKLFNAIKVSALALLLSFGLSFVYAWTAPTQNPPAGNVSAPINTSGTAQTKTGNLTVSATTTSSYFADLANSSFFVQPSGDSKFWNTTIAGTTTTNGLRVLNGAGANKVLTSDASGNATWQTAGGGGGQSDAVKAWVKFSGISGVVTVADGSNVSSVVRNSAGNYTVNFTTPMTNANYAAITNAGPYPNWTYPISQTASSYTFTTWHPNYGANDSNSIISVVVIQGATSGGGGGGVTSLIAGTNITLSPTSGVGAVTVNATVGGPAWSSAYNVNIGWNGGNSSYTHNLGHIPICEYTETNGTVSIRTITSTTITLHSASNDSGTIYCW